MVSKAERARYMLQHAEERRGTVRIACIGCGETVGHYRPGRVPVPSGERPMVRLKCLRRNCGLETFATLDEIVQ